MSHPGVNLLRVPLPIEGNSRKRASLSILFSDFILESILAIFVRACLECRRQVDARALQNQECHAACVVRPNNFLLQLPSAQSVAFVRSAQKPRGGRPLVFWLLFGFMRPPWLAVWGCYATAMGLPWAILWVCYGSAMGLPWGCYGPAMGLLCACHGAAMALLWVLILFF